MKKFITLCIVLFSLNSCNIAKTAVFDQYVYQKTIEIKVETENLIDKATTPYNEHLTEIEALNKELKVIMEYEKNRANNGISQNMWKLLTDPNKNFIGGFLQHWQRSQTVSPAFIPEAKQQINEAFNRLIQYEMKKDKSNENKLESFINSN